MLRIQRSEGKGLGLFAATPIPKGRLVAVYPNRVAKDEESTPYDLYLADGRRVTGDPWAGPVPCKKIRWGERVAHMINDGASLRRRDHFPGLLAYCRDWLDYVSESRRTNNVAHDGKGNFISTRDIASGEEVLFEYQVLYWTHQFYGEDVQFFITTVLQNMTTKKRLKKEVLAIITGGMQPQEMVNQMRIGFQSTCFCLGVMEMMTSKCRPTELAVATLCPRIIELILQPLETEEKRAELRLLLRTLETTVKKCNGLTTEQHEHAMLNLMLAAVGKQVK